jgi:hypothetical protein
MDEHMEQCASNNIQNRRNGVSKKHFAFSKNPNMSAKLILVEICSPL